MALQCFNYAYGKGSCEYWPSMSSGQPMPNDCRSRHNQKRGNVGLGIIEAISFLLTGQVLIGRDEDAFSVKYQSNRGGTSTVSSKPNPVKGDPRQWRGINRMKGPFLLCIVEAMLLETTGEGPDRQLEETQDRWIALLEELEVFTGHAAPFKKSELQEADKDQLCQRAVMALSDSLYFALKRADDHELRIFSDESGTSYRQLSDKDRKLLFDEPAPQKPDALPSGAVLSTLKCLLQTGGTALLVGPTGTFKTTTATRAALESGSELQVLKGRPGIEDRDFFGGIVPTEDGPTWIDGPITQAFKKAREHPTMLLMDEILRLEPLFLGALVGLLDPASPTELAARAIAPAPGFEQEPHYVAELPNGEQVACPTSQLTLVATTNMGHDYVQATQLDAALKGRFELTVEVDRPDPQVKRHLYQEAGQKHPAGSAAVADMLEEIEAAAQNEHIDHSGLLTGTAHPRLMLNMARHMMRLITAGKSPKEAATESARLTIAPNCVERDLSGHLSPAGVEVVLEITSEAAERYL